MFTAKEFGFRKWLQTGTPEQKKVFKRLRLSAYIGLHDLSKEARQAAWLLMLGVDTSSRETAALREFYASTVASEKSSPKSKQAENEIIIEKDVPRTFSSMKLFPQKPSSGKNKLFNILKVYSIYDPEVGYT